jgi:hypothetical protein
MESFIKESLIMKKEINSLNVFEAIQELKRMLIYKTNELFTSKDTGSLMSLSKYKRLIKEEMQKKNTPPFIQYIL